MKDRFQNNSDILATISDLNKINSDDFDGNSFRPLMDIGLKLPSEAELDAFKTKILIHLNYCCL